MLFLDNVTYHNSGRPIFYINDGCQCLGSGVIFYVKYSGKIYFLLQEEPNNNKYKFCDLGGKTDIKDNNIIETAVREVMEETNGDLFNKLFKSGTSLNDSAVPDLKDYMIKFYKIFQESPPRFVYSAKSKYLIILVELNINNISQNILPSRVLPVTPLKKEFGEIEIKTTLQRQIVWMDLNHFSQLLRDKKMHIRLKDTLMYKEIENLKHQARSDN